MPSTLFSSPMVITWNNASLLRLANLPISSRARIRRSTPQAKPIASVSGPPSSLDSPL